MKRLKKRERHDRIIGELRASPTVRVSEVAERLGVHVETIRRDLDELHRSGMVRRTYGGASVAPMAFEPSLAERHNLLVRERTRIGDVAASFIRPGDVIMIDVGSTTAHVARRLAAVPSEIMIITNSYAIAMALGNINTIRVIMCPGEYDAKQGGVSGADTIEFIKRFHANKAVIGAGGITPSGPTEFDPAFACVKRTMLEQSQERILVIDKSKFGRIVLDRICPLETFDQVVVDAPPSGDLMHALRNAGVRLHVAGE